ncbi:hypothetical protein SGLAM104S_10667 [Streptomyces glaucescens]
MRGARRRAEEWPAATGPRACTRRRAGQAGSSLPACGRFWDARTARSPWTPCSASRGCPACGGHGGGRTTPADAVSGGTPMR